jgi:hypothetical protein
MAKRKRDSDDYFICPCCGAEVRVGATFCRECGASDESGWNEEEVGREDDARPGDAADDDFDYDFDYDEFVAREFPDQAAPWSKHRVKRWVMGAVVAIVVAALTISAFVGFGR